MTPIAPAHYCEATFELDKDDIDIDIDVVRSRIAERFSVSRSAVSEMVQRLVELGLVEADDRQLLLTLAGQWLRGPFAVTASPSDCSSMCSASAGPRRTNSPVAGRT